MTYVCHNFKEILWGVRVQTEVKYGGLNPTEPYKIKPLHL
jgi:hypothetical protein